MEAEKYKRRLRQLERELAKRSGEDLQTARNTSDDRAEAGDRASVDGLKDEYLGLAQTDSETLAQVRAALGRIEDGTYGQCLIDGGPIEEKRLESVPWAPYCLKHQQEIEERTGVRTPSL
jgi:DnaK suppressor protein